MKDWADLDETFRESSRLQADDILHKLRLIDCAMAQTVAGRTAVTRLEPHEIRKLAEHEHERYHAERVRQGWTLGERDPAKQTSPFLVPWDDLLPKWRSLDEAAVATIPELLAEVGWHVYRKKSRRSPRKKR
jgi:hypothetical protein